MAMSNDTDKISVSIVSRHTLVAHRELDYHEMDAAMQAVIRDFAHAGCDLRPLPRITNEDRVVISLLNKKVYLWYYSPDNNYVDCSMAPKFISRSDFKGGEPSEWSLGVEYEHTLFSTNHAIIATPRQLNELFNLGLSDNELVMHKMKGECITNRDLHIIYPVPLVLSDQFAFFGLDSRGITWGNSDDYNP